MLHLLIIEVKPEPLYPHIEMLSSVKALLLEPGLLRSEVYSFLLLRIIGFLLSSKISLCRFEGNSKTEWISYRYVEEEFLWFPVIPLQAGSLLFCSSEK